jgi:hypothetical protein
MKSGDAASAMTEEEIKEIQCECLRAVNATVLRELADDSDNSNDNEDNGNNEHCANFYINGAVGRKCFPLSTGTVFSVPSSALRWTAGLAAALSLGTVDGFGINGAVFFKVDLLFAADEIETTGITAAEQNVVLLQDDDWLDSTLEAFCIDLSQTRQSHRQPLGPPPLLQHQDLMDPSVFELVGTSRLLNALLRDVLCALLPSAQVSSSSRFGRTFFCIFQCPDD